MNNREWFKNQSILVARAGQGLKLVNLKSNRVCCLDPEQATVWLNWNERTSSIEETFLNKLVEGEFVIGKERIREEHIINKPDGLGQIVPGIAGKNIRWNEETPDLYILFNSAVSKKEPPVLILGPLGSMCWKGIINGHTINRICEAVNKAFGNSNKVAAILKRLADCGFIKKIDCIESVNAGDSDINEISVQDLLTHIPHLNVPWYCSWEICSACNLRCRHCYLPDYSNIGVSTEAALEVSQHLIDSGVFHVIIMGGEPLLRKDIEIIAEKLRDGGIYVSIITNGQLLSEERAKSLAASGVGMVFISFDGFNPEVHEMIRGKGTFIKSMEAVKNAQKAGIPRVAVSWAINSSNVGEFQKLPEFLNSIEVSECYLEVFRQTGLSGSQAPFKPISVKEVGMIKQFIKNWAKKYPHQYISFTTQCLCGRNRMKVGDNGDAFVCPFLNESIGNVFETPVINLWRSIEHCIPPKGPAGYCRSVRELYLLHMYG